MKKTAIVTGGGRGIGFAVSRALGKDGYQVVIVGSSRREAYEDHLRELDSLGIVSHYIQADVGDCQTHGRIVEETVQTFGGIHVLVNNAGVAPNVRADLLEMIEESFDRVLRINLKGNMFLTQAAAKQMMRQPPEGKKRGTIVNISSCSAEVVSVNRGEYCVSKAGISMLTQLYAARLAPEQILVHEVRPGVIRTDMTKGVGEKYDRLIQEGRFPIARWGEPEDVADAVSALCSDRFLYTTGDVIDVDGGFHIKQP